MPSDRDEPQRPGPSGTPNPPHDAHADGNSTDSNSETIESGSSLLIPSDIASGARSADEAVSARGPDLEREGRTIGRYALLKKIGEGGFGVVYMAEQRQPVTRRVALKIIKLGMDTRQVIARFEAERQALAMMDHPHIAKVLDAGATDTGRPYFVMEFVQGVPITEFCDKHSMSLRDRLKLFTQVCGAVQHAHQKGIIHRDLKPSNVLVTIIDDKPAPKVIDFGIAKATQARLTEQTMFTEIGQFIGTPAYMSPEQSDPTGIDIDTRSDIYSLGVLLYELLTGGTPFDVRSLRKAGFEEIKRIIREEEPHRPSTRLSGLGADLDTVARQRGVESRKLGAILRGDLDWIIMKALEKDRARRYETANGLAMDIERYLTGEAVVAAPPSAAYRLEKFVRRNRGKVAAAGAIAASLILGIVAFAWQARVASGQRDRALEAEEQARRRANELAQVSEFQAQMLAQVDPTTAGVRLTEDVRARFDAALAKTGVSDEEREREAEAFASHWSRVNATDTALKLIDLTILAPTVMAIDRQFAEQPAVAARLRNVLAARYHDLGFDEDALKLEQQALTERRDALGEDHPDTVSSMCNVAVYLNGLGRSNEAEPYNRAALEKSLRLRGANDPETLLCVANLGVTLLEIGQFDEAERYHREALDGRRRVLGPTHDDTLVSVNNFATLLQAQGKPSDAEPYLRDVLETRRRVLGDDHPETLISLNNLASLLWDLRKRDEAVACFREVTERRRRVLGDVHPKTLISMQSLGTTLGACGQADEAEALMREALTNQRRLMGADHPSAINSLSNLAVFLINHGKLSEAEPMCREALDRRRRILGANHRETLISNNVMGYMLRKQDRGAEAEPFVRDSLRICTQALGPKHPDTFLYTHNLALLLRDQEKLDEAEALLREVVYTGGPTIGASHPTVLSGACQLGDMFLTQERYAEAAELLSSTAPAAREYYTGPRAPDLGGLLKDLGVALTRLGEFASAEPALIEAHAIFEVAGDAEDAQSAARTLVKFYEMWEAAEPGQGHQAKQAEWQAKLPAENPPEPSAPASAP